MQIRVFLVFQPLTVLASICPICRTEIVSFLSSKNISVFSYAVTCVFILANAYIMIATCVADVLPVHIVAGRNKSTTWNGLSSTGSSLTKPDSDTLFM